MSNSFAINGEGFWYRGGARSPPPSLWRVLAYGQ